MSNPIQFVKFFGTPTAEQISNFDANAIYFIEETGQIYQGSKLFGGGEASPIQEIQINGTTIDPTENVINIEIPIKEIQFNGNTVTPTNGVINLEETQAPIQRIQFNGKEVVPVNGVVSLNETETEVPIREIQLNGATVDPINGVVNLNVSDSGGGDTPSENVTRWTYVTDDETNVTYLGILLEEGVT